MSRLKAGLVSLGIVALLAAGLETLRPVRSNAAIGDVNYDSATQFCSAWKYDPYSSGGIAAAKRLFNVSTTSDAQTAIAYALTICD